MVPNRGSDGEGIPLIRGLEQRETIPREQWASGVIAADNHGRQIRRGTGMRLSSMLPRKNGNLDEPRVKRRKWSRANAPPRTAWPTPTTGQRCVFRGMVAHLTAPSNRGNNSQYREATS